MDCCVSSALGMLSLGSQHHYLFYQAPCDMRKSFDGLCGLVRDELNRDPTQGDVFVFVNRRRTHLKLLVWEPGGFVLWYKRLEAGTYPPPRLREGQVEISWADLVLMIEGIRVERSVQTRRYYR